MATVRPNTRATWQSFNSVPTFYKSLNTYYFTHPSEIHLVTSTLKVLSWSILNYQHLKYTVALPNKHSCYAWQSRALLRLSKVIVQNCTFESGLKHININHMHPLFQQTCSCALILTHVHICISIFSGSVKDKTNRQTKEYVSANLYTKLCK